MINKYVKKFEDLVTTYEQTRAGFLKIALEKNIIGTPYVENAKAFKAMALQTTKPEQLIDMASVRPFLVTASGLSEKAVKYIDDEDQIMAVKELVEKFLKPAGKNYIEEAIYRYLLIKGDALGGMMRNRIGALGQERLIRAILSCANVRGLKYCWLENSELTKTVWNYMSDDDLDIEKKIKAIYWKNNKGNRVLSFNLNIPIVKKNVDICLFNSSIEEYEYGKIVSKYNKTIMLGELKAGIDPAGADEHWKTANTALERIRNSFEKNGFKILTSFVGAAIEYAMAEEIFNQLRIKKLSNVANLTNDYQLTEFCNWILDL